MSPADAAADGDLPLSKVLAWIATPVVGAVVGLTAVFVEKWFAPIGLFPLLLGIAVGVGLLLPMHWIGPRRMRTLVVAAVIAALGCVATHHLGGYLVWKHAAETEAAKTREQIARLNSLANFNIPEPSPPNLVDYYSLQWREGRLIGEHRVVRLWLAGWWMLDALLVWLAAAVTTVYAYVRPGPSTTAALSPSERSPGATP